MGEPVTDGDDLLPTDAPAGSQEKIAVLRARVRYRRFQRAEGSLHHPDDSREQIPPPDQEEATDEGSDV